MTLTQVRVALLFSKAFFIGVKLAHHPDPMDIAKDLVELLGELTLFALESKPRQ